VTRPADLLPSCAVRVEVGGTPKGTGFFVAPTTIVTCAHVIERLIAPDPIQVVDHTGASYPVEVAQVERDDKVDVAILKVTGAAEDRLCVLLDSEVDPNDQLYTYGYTERYSEGEPTTLEAEGRMGNGWIKLKNGQVKPGMSGSPVLNMANGSVFAILKRSRDPEFPLGGYAVPIDVALKLDPTLRRTNALFHQAHGEWFAQLGPDRQRRLRKSWGSQAATPVPQTYFVLTVGPAAGGSGWLVEAEIKPSGVRIPPVQVDLNLVRLEVARLFRDWASRGRVFPEAEQVRLLGSILYGAVFPGQVGEKFREVTGQAGRGRVIVALRFAEGTEPDLVNLPWEHLFRPKGFSDAGMQLAIERSVAFVRTLDAELADAPAALGEGLRILVVAIEPKRFKPVEDVVEHLQKTVAGRPGVTVDVLETPTPLQLEEGLEGYDVLHYVGFGRFQEGQDRIALADEVGDVDYVSIDVIADSLRPPEPRLVVLELCPTEGENVVPADFAALAPSLLGQVPAVLAYQFPLSPEDTETLNAKLYDQLAEGAPVDEAVQEARKKLRVSGRAYTSPALWVRRPGRLCLVASTSDSGTPQQPQLVGSHG
jgi:hypothetical protein